MVPSSLYSRPGQPRSTGSGCKDDRCRLRFATKLPAVASTLTRGSFGTPSRNDVIAGNGVVSTGFRQAPFRGIYSHLGTSDVSKRITRCSNANLNSSQAWQNLPLPVTRYTPATLQTSRTTTIVADEEPYYRLSFTVQVSTAYPRFLGRESVCNHE